MRMKRGCSEHVTQAVDAECRIDVFAVTVALLPPSARSSGNEYLKYVCIWLCGVPTACISGHSRRGGAAKLQGGDEDEGGEVANALFSSEVSSWRLSPGTSAVVL